MNRERPGNSEPRLIGSRGRGGGTHFPVQTTTVQPVGGSCSGSLEPSPSRSPSSPWFLLLSEPEPSLGSCLDLVHAQLKGADRASKLRFSSTPEYGGYVKSPPPPPHGADAARKAGYDAAIRLPAGYGCAPGGGSVLVAGLGRAKPLDRQFHEKRRCKSPVWGVVTLSLDVFNWPRLGKG
jgi:hypothetical protein